MNKILVIAKREYRAMVGSKGFIIALALMPVLMFGGIVAHGLLEGRVGPQEKTIVVVDGTGELFDRLAEAAEKRNETQVFDPESGRQAKPRLSLQRSAADQATDDLRFELSERIRRGEIDWFVEIPAGIMAMPSEGEGPKVEFYGENTALAEEKRWIGWALSEAVRTHRLQEAGLDPELVRRAGAPVPVEGRGLVELSPEGEVEEAREGDEMLSVFVPFGLMMLMFMVIFLAAQPMLESVMEEKSQRIAEVLLGAAHPFQLMAGKLLGGVGGSLTIVGVYGVGAYLLASHYDMAQYVPLRVLPWFLVFQVLAVFLFGSVFMAVGSAVNQLKEAQGMLLPVWLVMMFPMFVWFHVIREPTSGFATAISFVPPATPLLMVLRLAATESVPWWEPAAGIVVLLATTVLCVYAAARIFRVGILAQGKTPSLAELVRWAVSA